MVAVDRPARFSIDASPAPALRLGHLDARPAAGHDTGFLSRLYASTRTDLLYLPVPREVAMAIIAQQEQLQRRGYEQAYPQAQFLVLEHLGAPVGRLVLNAAAGELRVVDLSVEPGQRRRGHARAVLRSLQEWARREGTVVSLRVRKDNPNARALYASLGFAPVSGDEVSEQMRWTPHGAVQNE
jgi:ribosomal protein S18 acetylase RimI-like enzyme